jgi:2-(1,2-epoxy-1,2-dihydrophenyl)acetyl-CoA isomerase
MKNEYLSVEKTGPVLTLTIYHSGGFHSFHPDLITGLTFAIHNAQKDADIKVIILSDSGCSSSSGCKVKAECQDFSKTDIGFGMLNECILTIKKSKKPIIASVHGLAADAIFNLAFASDMIVASENSQFLFNPARKGSSGELSGASFQARLIGPYLTKQFDSNGASISASRLHQIGAINYIVPLDKLKEETTKLALRVANVSEKAFGMIKKFIDTSLIDALEAILEQERLNNKWKNSAKDRNDGDLCF